MADPLTLSTALVPIVQNLLAEGLVRGFDVVLRRTPVHKAIRSTTERFDTRCSGVQAALETWITCEAFKSEVESLGGGQLARTDAEHVDLFISSSGLQHGTVNFETARDILIFFYSQLYTEICVSGEGPKLIGTQILSVNTKLDRLLDLFPPESRSTKSPASSGISSRRSRSGGSRISITFSR
jgi:hypothetical protein